MRTRRTIRGQTVSGTITLGVWDGTTVRIYIDGSNANTTSATLTQPMRVDDEPICIGNIAGNTSTLCDQWLLEWWHRTM